MKKDFITENSTVSFVSEITNDRASVEMIFENDKEKETFVFVVDPDVPDNTLPQSLHNKRTQIVCSIISLLKNLSDTVPENNIVSVKKEPKTPTNETN
jgi:hypothetical protein